MRCPSPVMSGRTLSTWPLPGALTWLTWLRCARQASPSHPVPLGRGRLSFWAAHVHVEQELGSRPSWRGVPAALGTWASSARTVGPSSLMNVFPHRLVTQAGFGALCARRGARSHTTFLISSVRLFQFWPQGLFQLFLLLGCPLQPLQEPGGALPAQAMDICKGPGLRRQQWAGARLSLSVDQF